MRYMVFVKMREDVGPPTPELVEAMGASMASAFGEGWMTDAGGLYPTAASTEIRLHAGRVSSVDGPFAEAKEVVGGYAIIEVDSHEAAVAKAREMIELHLTHWPGWEGSAEVRRVSGPDEGPPPGR